MAFPSEVGKIRKRRQQQRYNVHRMSKDHRKATKRQSITVNQNNTTLCLGKNKFCCFLFSVIPISVKIIANKTISLSTCTRETNSIFRN